MKQLILSFFLTSLVTFMLVLLLILVFALFKTKISAKAKYLIWFLTLMSFLLPFRPQFGSGLIRMNAGQSIPSVTTSVQTEASQQVSQASGKLAEPNLWEPFLSLPWFEIILVIWLLGFVFNISRYLISYLRFKKMLNRWGSTIDDSEMLAHLKEIQEEMGIKRKIRLLHYSLSQSPMLVGFRDVLIVLPEVDYTEEELQLIFKHELTHYQHHDVFVNLLIILVKSLHWFNPIVALACRETQEVGEIYCDYDVLNKQDNHYRIFYGETILTMIDRSKKTPIALTTCFYSEKFNLKRRIVSIMDSRLPKKYLSSGFIVTVSLLLILTSSVFAIENSVSHQQKSQTETVQSENTKLGQEQALASALKSVSLTENDITDLKVSQSGDSYQFNFSYKQTAYEMTVSSQTGDVLQSKQHTVVEKTVTVEKEVSSSSTASSNNSSPDAGHISSASASHSNTSSGTSSQSLPSSRQSQSRQSRNSDDDDDDHDHDDDDDDD